MRERRLDGKEPRVMCGNLVAIAPLYIVSIAYEEEQDDQ